MAAPGTLDFAQLITNIGTIATPNSGPVWALAFGISYLLALIFAFIAAMQLKTASEERGGVSYKAPLLSFIAAVCFAAIPETASTFGTTIFGPTGNSAVLAYVPGTPPTSPFAAVMAIVATLGLFFFMRGIVEIKRAGEPQRYQNASISRALFMLGGGVAAIHIDVSIKVLAATFGWDVSAYLT
jgi:hypothetical protein